MKLNCYDGMCSSEEAGDVATCSKRHVREEELAKDDLKKSRLDSKVESAEGRVVEGGETEAFKSEEAPKTEAAEEEGESAVKEFIIGKTSSSLPNFNLNLYFCAAR